MALIKKPTQPAVQPGLADWTSEKAGVANISELARASGKDRATVRKALEAAGVAPVRSKAKEKQFDVQQATAALGAAHNGNGGDGYHRARTQKTTAEAARILLKLQRERGELAPVAELREGAYVLVKGMHQRFTRYAREARGRLYRAKSVSDLERILSSDIAVIFDDLKRDYPNIL